MLKQAKITLLATKKPALAGKHFFSIIAKYPFYHKSYGLLKKLHFHKAESKWQECT